MSADNVTLGTSFVAGVLSFLSPCVLPIVPGYLSYLAGVSLEELQLRQDRQRLVRDVALNAALFVLGFSLVFVALGATATVIGEFLRRHTPAFVRLGGLLVIVLGLHMTRILPIPWLYRERRLEVQRRAGLVGSVLVGAAFAFGWTPCLGPILATILMLASTQETVVQGVALLAVYSAGLGIPFLLTGLAIGSFFGFYRRARRYMTWFERASGLLLILIGVLLLTDRLGWLAAKLTFLQPFAR